MQMNSILYIFCVKKWHVSAQKVAVKLSLFCILIAIKHHLFYRVGGGRRSGLSGAPSCNFTEDSFTKPHEFAPRRALILSKVSR